MTPPVVGSSLTEPIPSTLKKKRLLLIDGSRTKRDLRAEVMRKLGIEVDCAADIAEARSWWRADLYNLVVINVENERGRRDKFCEEMRTATPPQHLAFLVGKPAYLADRPHADGGLSGEGDDGLVMEQHAVRSTNPSDDLRQRWGILEASQRISAVRSASHARTKAIRERPEPPRDFEIRVSKLTGESRTLDELLREEMQ
jgi:CheY-like chemotaxis protein